VRLRQGVTERLQSPLWGRGEKILCKYKDIVPNVGMSWLIQDVQEVSCIAKDVAKIGTGMMYLLRKHGSSPQ
jgi:hypothetical protein